MKFLRIREVYWLEASTRATRVIENVTPTTVIIEPAIVDNIWREPSALAPNRCGQRASHCEFAVECTLTNAIARAMLNARISEGTNQKLDRRLLQSCFSLFIAYLHFLLRTPELPGLRNPCRCKSFVAGWITFVHCQDAFVVGNQRICSFYKFLYFHLI